MLTMSSLQIETPEVDTLPPFICGNLHEKITTDKISVTDLMKSQEKVKICLVEVSAPLEKPLPLHPLTITWAPDHLDFEITTEAVVKKLWVWNTSRRTIYIHCCNLWDETAYLGAGWRCSPKTRFHLAPGLRGEVFIRAVPKSVSPIPFVVAKLQLAAAHKRDNVTGFFAVPIMVKFLNNVGDPGEGG